MQCSSQYHVVLVLVILVLVLLLLVLVLVVPELLNKFEFFGFLRVREVTSGLLRVN